MTHSQQPSIEVLQKLRNQTLSLPGVGSVYVLFDRMFIEAISRIQAIPQEPSLEDLLEDMKALISFSLRYERSTDTWVANGFRREDGQFLYSERKTPTEALLALKEKLTK